jgi:hypothetical protein
VAKRKKRKTDPLGKTEVEAGWPAPVTVAVAERMDRTTQRDVLAGISGFLTILVVSGGLIRLGPWLQVGIIAGIAVGLVASSVRRAAVMGLLAAVAGVALAPPNAWLPPPDVSARLWQAAVVVGTTVLAAALVRHLLSLHARAAPLLLATAVVLLIGNLWATTFAVNSKPTFDPSRGVLFPSLNEQLEGPLPDAMDGTDIAVYYRVERALRNGEPFYDAFTRINAERAQGMPPSSVLNFRLPVLFYFWSWLPDRQWIVYSFLLLSTAALIAAMSFASHFVRAPLTLPAVGALAAYFSLFPSQLIIFSQGSWAACLGLCSLACIAMSHSGTRRWMWWTVAAVVLAVLGTMVRETLVFLMIGGIVSLFWVEGSHRRTRLGAWIAGWALLLSVYSLHFWRARAFVDPESSAGRFAEGSVEFMLAALRYATHHLGRGGWLPPVLALLGVVGVLLLPQVRLRVLGLFSTLAPLGTFLILGNDATMGLGGPLINYWGATVVPFLYAFVPAVFAAVPVARRASISQSGGLSRAFGDMPFRCMP